MSRTTFENAEFTARMLKESGHDRVSRGVAARSSSPRRVLTLAMSEDQKIEIASAAKAV
jgi:hypothetical protein